MKLWVGILSVLIIVAGIWLGIVYGQEILDDTKNYVEDNFVTDTENNNTNSDTEGEIEGEDTSARVTLTVSATGQILAIN